MSEIKHFLIALLSFLATYSGCYQKEDTWSEWCNRILETRESTFFSATDYNSIKNDFIKNYHEMIIDYNATNLLGNVKRDDPVIIELERLKMIGAHREEDNLIIALNIGRTGYDNFSPYVQRYKMYIDRVSKGESMDSGYQYCVFSTIDSFFDNIIIKGIDGSSETIELNFYLKNYLQSNSASN